MSNWGDGIKIGRLRGSVGGLCRGDRWGIGEDEVDSDWSPGLLFLR